MQYLTPFLRALGVSLGAMASLMAHAHAADVNAWRSARVDQVITDPQTLDGLSDRVKCRPQAGSGTLLLVSRSWGGSPNLRHQQVVRWTDGPVAEGDRVAVQWGGCDEQARNLGDIDASSGALHP